MTTKDNEALFQALLDGKLPDADGRFGPYGGRYVPETLMPAINRLTEGVYRYLPDPEFHRSTSPLPCCVCRGIRRTDKTS